jgi:hypothetical protein
MTTDRVVSRIHGQYIGKPQRRATSGALVRLDIAGVDPLTREANMTIITYGEHRCYHRHASLFFLLDYALSHPHSAQWIGAIALLPGKEMSHG